MAAQPTCPGMLASVLTSRQSVCVWGKERKIDWEDRRTCEEETATIPSIKGCLFSYTAGGVDVLMAMITVTFD